MSWNSWELRHFPNHDIFCPYDILSAIKRLFRSSKKCTQIVGEGSAATLLINFTVLAI